MTRGDTKQIGVSVTRNDSPVDLTGATIWMSAKRSYPDTVYVFQISTVTDDVEITDEEGGLATVTIPPDATSGLSSQVNTLVYDIQVRESDGTITTVGSGTITVNPDVTTET